MAKSNQWCKVFITGQAELTQSTIKSNVWEANIIIPVQVPFIHAAVCSYIGGLTCSC